MERKQLGRTGVFLPAIGQGTTGTGPLSSRDIERDRHRVRVLRRGIELGMNFIDTAELYGGGHGEEIAGQAVAGVRHQVFLSSKFNPSHSTSPAMELALEGSLRRLGTDYLDLYQFHWPNPFVPLEETFGGLSRLVEKGKIRYIGLSNFSLPEIEKACRIADIASLQMEYNLTERGIESEVLQFCEQQGMTLLAYSPLDRSRRVQELPIVQQIAAKHERSPSQIVLNWVISSPAVVAITMTTKLEHVAESAAASDFRLSSEDVSALEEATRCTPAHIVPSHVQVAPGIRPVYLSLEEARENALDLVPHPIELAENIRRYGIEKPIRVVRNSDDSSPKQYRLVDEHLRYWAWVIAYGWERLIPAYILA